MHGEGKIVYPNGKTFEGTFQHDKKHGKGKITYKSGSILEGQWVLGK